MMLPGVELARRRRIHHHHHGISHEIYPAGRVASPSEPWMRPRFERTAMDESAIVARNRLEEKLHRHRSIPITVLLTDRLLSRPGSSVRTTGVEGPVPAEAGPARAVLKRKDSVTDVCPVCLEELRARGPVTNLACSHKYHSDCLRPWLTDHSHCPCCRRLVS